MTRPPRRHGRAETDSPRRGSEIAGARSIETFYDSVLLKANRSQVCLGCNRGVSHEELPALEQYVRGHDCAHNVVRGIDARSCTQVKRKKQQAPEALRGLEEQRDDWQQQLDTLKALAPTEAVYQRLVKEELPAAKDALTAEEEKLAPARDKAKEQADRLTEVKDASRDLQTLKRAASDVLRLFRECEDVDREVAKLESELSATGSTATTEEIQDKLSALADHM